VVGPEFRTATRGVFARHSYLGLQQNNEKLENEIEDEVRRRITGKHIEVSSVTMEEIASAPEIAAAVQARLVGEQEAVRKKAALENDALRQKLELEHEAERARLHAEADLAKKKHERALADEQSQIDRTRAETEAATKLIDSKAEAASISMLAKAHAEEKKAEALALTPMAVMMHAYDALGKLGGEKTTLLLGDWSHVPNFLFPKMLGFPSIGGVPMANR
jgi:hypothetical protein